MDSDLSVITLSCGQSFMEKKTVKELGVKGRASQIVFKGVEQSASKAQSFSQTYCIYS